MLDTVTQWMSAHRLETIVVCIIVEMVANAIILGLARKSLFFALPGLVFVKLIDYGRSVILLMIISFVFLATALIGMYQSEPKRLVAFLELAVIAIVLKLLVAWGMKRMKPEPKEQ